MRTQEDECRQILGLAPCDDADDAANDGGTGTGVVAAALQALVGENAALRQGVLETKRELREALFKKQSLVREFEALKVEKKLMKCGYEEMKRKYLECSRFFFLDASKHLYKRVCPSVRPYVRMSVRPLPIRISHFERIFLPARACSTKG